MKKYFVNILLLLLCANFVSAQSFRIYFTDKGPQEMLAVDPTSILSEEALLRRAKHDIPLDYIDLPVAKQYEEKLRSLGLEIQMNSRWLNYTKVSNLTDPEAVLALPFVKRLEKIELSSVEYASSTSVAADTVIYGFSANQIEMVNGQYLHNIGSLGQGMRIAVLDGGFQGSKNLTGLDSLWADGRVKDFKSFISSDTNVFSGGSHGTSVLSVLAGYIDSSFVGSAWKADYYLYRTEFEPTETVAEMDNWVAAAERADSMGVDIITSSLGYTQFDAGIGDYRYVDLDGNTTVVTRAADLAASRGILVVVSAGNLGDARWQYISAPADGDSVLAIGGADPNGVHASFSSWGPSADGRIKPDVSAQAIATAILTPAGVSFGNGTSFSCPIISGLAACLWQNNPSMSNIDILEAIRSTASQNFNPDNFLGFGLANFRDAQWNISQPEYNPKQSPVKLNLYPNPSNGSVSLDFSEVNEVKAVRIHDLKGNLMQEYLQPEQQVLQIELPRDLGIYLLSVYTSDRIYLEKVIRH